jgi:hypothetical protein
MSTKKHRTPQKSRRSLEPLARLLRKLLLQIAVRLIIIIITHGRL